MIPLSTHRHIRAKAISKVVVPQFEVVLKGSGFTVC
jgi:hypothetical protein